MRGHYEHLLREIESRIRRAQLRASLAANRELEHLELKEVKSRTGHRQIYRLIGSGA